MGALFRRENEIFANAGLYATMIQRVAIN